MKYYLSFIFLFFISAMAFSQQKTQNNSFTSELTLKKSSDTAKPGNEKEKIIFSEKPERKQLKNKSNGKKSDKKNVSDFQFTPEPTRISPANKK